MHIYTTRSVPFSIWIGKNPKIFFLIISCSFIQHYILIMPFKNEIMLTLTTYFIFRSPMDTLFPIAQTEILLYNSGTVMWVPPFTISSRCPMPYRNYITSEKPFIECGIRMGSWTSSEKMLDLQLDTDKVILEMLYWKLIFTFAKFTHENRCQFWNFQQQKIINCNWNQQIPKIKHSSIDIGNLHNFFNQFYSIKIFPSIQKLQKFGTNWCVIQWKAKKKIFFITS